jgi:hypothetical protein
MRSKARERLNELILLIIIWDTPTGLELCLGGRREKDPETIQKQVQHMVRDDRSERLFISRLVRPLGVARPDVETSSALGRYKRIRGTKVPLILLLCT